MDDRQLRREIAELLGYKYEKREYWDEFQLRVNDQYAENEFWQNVPDWSDDLDAALTLIEHIDKAEITRVFTAGENWQWFVRLPLPNTERFVYGTRLQDSVHSIDYKLSRAICEAWLLWMNKQHE